MEYGMKRPTCGGGLVDRAKAKREAAVGKEGNPGRERHR